VTRTDRQAPLPAAFQPVLAKLRVDAGAHFGCPDARLCPVAYEERPYSHLLRVRVLTGGDASESPHVFVKIFKPKPHDGGVEKMRTRVAHEFGVTRRIHEAMAAWPDLSVVRPVACYVDDLAIVTEQEPGVTLLVELHRRGGWFPSSETLCALESTMTRVGAWVRAFQQVETGSGQVPVAALRDYVDIRLSRLTSHGVMRPRDRTRLLGHLDALGRKIEASELREVIAHADLAPGNILVAGDRIVVLDFAMTNRATTLHDISRLFVQLDLLKAKPQFRASVVRRLQTALLCGFDPALAPDRPLFRYLLMLHRVNHLGTLALGRERFPSSVFNGHLRRMHRRWIQAELEAGATGRERH
jgi:hypothetical protein